MNVTSFSTLHASCLGTCMWQLHYIWQEELFRQYKVPKAWSGLSLSLTIVQLCSPVLCRRQWCCNQQFRSLSISLHASSSWNSVDITRLSMGASCLSLSRPTHVSLLRATVTSIIILHARAWVSMSQSLPFSVVRDNSLSITQSQASELWCSLHAWLDVSSLNIILSIVAFGKPWRFCRSQWRSPPAVCSLRSSYNSNRLARTSACLLYPPEA